MTDTAERASCAQPVWDGPYKMTCGHLLVGGRCIRHGQQPDPSRDPDESPSAEGDA